MRKTMAKKQKLPKLYFYLETDVAEGDSPYFSQFDTLEFAVDESKGREIFSAELKSIGFYEKQIQVVKVSRPKEKLAKAKKIAVPNLDDDFMGEPTPKKRGPKKKK